MRRLAVTAFFAGCFALAAGAAHADTDACTLLTPAQVGAAAGVPVGVGTHVTPTFVKTCTWTPPAGSRIASITLNVQTASFYDGGKQSAAMVAAAAGAGKTSMKAASVGDDAYYFTTGDQVSLFVKKGGASFKVAVYASKVPVAEKEAIELKLAREVLK